MVRRVRELLLHRLSPGATVAIISKGDEELIRIRGLQGCHFPQSRGGEYAGYHPGTSAEAITYLEAVRSRGASYLVIPATALWWLNYYGEFRDYLFRHYERSFEDPDTCVIYNLTPAADVPAAPVATLSAAPSLQAGASSAGDERTESRPEIIAGDRQALHRLFDSGWYLDQNPDVRASGMDPFVHYLQRGAQQGRSPHPLFDPKFYWKTYPDSARSGLGPLEHYLAFGWRKGYRPNPNFDPAFYLCSYPDVAAAGIEPLTHFACTGMREGRLGCPEVLQVESYQPGFTISRAAGAYPCPAGDLVRAIAFYLPQFHRIPENERWWGKNFTDWVNVRKGNRQFRGHYQPHVPSTMLGYYDLRDPTVLETQAALARKHGIHGFCFYYYWFGGKVLLDRPLANLIKRGKPDFPFCICWANENWTRRWDGLDQEILIAQKHSPDDDLAFLRRVEPVLRHPNYIRIGGRPLLLVYRPGILPDARATAKRWRQYFRAKGHGELYLAMTMSFHDKTPPHEYGLDAAVQFPPHMLTRPVNYLVRGKNAAFRGAIHDYNHTKQVFLDDLSSCHTHSLFPGVMPSWDNTARRGGAANIWINSSPESYYDWLSTAAEYVRRRPEIDERLVFINAWNEWGEGCHLEPDRRHGHAWLNATRLALQPKGEAKAVLESPQSRTKRPARPHPTPTRPLEVAFASHDAHPHGAQYCLLTLAEWMKAAGLVSPRFILAGSGPLVDDFARLGPVLRLDKIPQPSEDGNARVQRLMSIFCGPHLSAVYINSAAAGHVCRWTKSLRVPHIVHVHELEESLKRWVGLDKMSAIRDCANLVIAASDPVADNLRGKHGIAKEKLRTIPESIRCTGIRAARPAEKRRCRSWLGLSTEGPLVLGCGTTDWRKGPDLFIEVAAIVRREYRRPVHFVWVGGQTRADEIPELQRRTVRMQLSDTVRFLGPVATPLPYMMASDLFLLPSREDPFPLVCLEAADCGLPTVCFARAGGIPDFVGATCGAVVPYLNVRRMAREVLSFLNDDAKRRQRGRNARVKVRAQFDVSVKGREIYDAMRAACSGE